MKIRRTSVKTGFVAIVLFIIYIVAGWAAANLYERTTVIRFSGGGGRSWNGWDYVSSTSIFLGVSFAAVSLMFLNKDD